jgi:hypothetical protein
VAILERFNGKFLLLILLVAFAVLSGYALGYVVYAPLRIALKGKPQEVTIASIDYQPKSMPGSEGGDISFEGYLLRFNEVTDSVWIPKKQFANYLEAKEKGEKKWIWHCPGSGSTIVSGKSTRLAAFVNSADGGLPYDALYGVLVAIGIARRVRGSLDVISRASGAETKITSPRAGPWNLYYSGFLKISVFSGAAIGLLIAVSVYIVLFRIAFLANIPRPFLGGVALLLFLGLATVPWPEALIKAGMEIKREDGRFTKIVIVVGIILALIAFVRLIIELFRSVVFSDHLPDNLNEVLELFLHALI